MTWLDILTIAYRKAGVLSRAGRGMSGSEQQEAQSLLNAHLDGLKIERCFVYEVTRNLVPINQNQQYYTICDPAVGAQYGITPDWPFQRPEHILGAGFILPGGPPSNTAEIPMEVLLDFSQFKAITNKQVTSSQPRVLYYTASLVSSVGAPSGTGPAGTVFLWPLPYQAGQIAIYLREAINEVQDIGNDVFLPQGYREFLEYSMACAVHENYPNAPMSPTVETRAMKYKARVMANQFTPVFISSDPAALSKPSLNSMRWFDARNWPGGYQ